MCWRVRAVAMRMRVAIEDRSVLYLIPASLGLPFEVTAGCRMYHILSLVNLFFGFTWLTMFGTWISAACRQSDAAP